MHITNVLTLALRLATDAGNLISQQRPRLSVEFKGGTELVTQADVAADELICRGIRQVYPDHQILSEELNPDGGTDAEHLWIIDPIDGTVNYAHHHPQVAISIAYYHKGKAKVAVVHNPFMQETFHAIAGKGARLNDHPIRCSTKSELGRALVATGFPYVKDDLPRLMGRLNSVLTRCADVRRLGSAALDICWLACGRMDAYYETVKPWDFAAAQLIARESGATVGHIYPLPADANPEIYSENLLMSAPALFLPLQKLLQAADQESVIPPSTTPVPPQFASAQGS
ncbi:MULTISPECIES: inositol monophosphatase family protein [Thalassolituus]|jgi:myo-inositol-1(or 4)-monophosphatase|uniref:inositol monophosphatase family protein n=1 Tax=Thalassolituus TaxID=187492 RepID=UPI001CE2E1DF|nr:inositol monophosphatase family protein [Thalassolituus oleivorans]MCA6128498.1 inositol phosphatase [Thalassolituus oleivorans 4BN06-13]